MSMGERWSRTAELPLAVEEIRLSRLEAQVTSGFARVTTVVELRGAGKSGFGEDVTYDAEDHEALLAWDGLPDLCGEATLGGFCDHLSHLDLFPREPGREDFRYYRRWGFEAAALDLALRQAGRTLPDAMGIEAAPPRFVVSIRLGEPPTTEPIEKLLASQPGLGFKLDPTSSWSEELVGRLRELACVAAVDLKGAYRGTAVDQAPDPDLYRLVAEGLPGAWIEDPALTPETRAALKGHEDRITWDAPIHSWRDVEALERGPRCLNVKPSRFGSWRELLGFYERCDESGIELYGGGQFELGVGRAQIQELAALFHADAPNDIAPRAYNEAGDGVDPSRLAPSPLELAFEEPGFGRAAPG